MRQTLFIFFLSLFIFSGCNSDDNWDDPYNEISTSEIKVENLVRYAKLNFEENFEHDSIFNSLIMHPVWDSLDVVKQSVDSLVLCFPIETEMYSDNRYFLFVNGGNSIVRFCIVGISNKEEENNLGLDLRYYALPEVTVIADKCLTMSHICSDPYDYIFLEYLMARSPRLFDDISTGGGGGNSASPLGKDYPWDNLNSSEKSFVKRHPVAAKKFFDNAKEATIKVANEPGQHNGKADAMRHAYWSALNAKAEGEALAKEFGNAHESTVGLPSNEVAMDKFNNLVGYQIGTQAAKNNWSQDRIYQEVQNAASSGKLQLKPNN